MIPSPDHVYQIPEWIARQIPALIGPEESIWAEAYPPVGDPDPKIAFTTFETLSRLAVEPVLTRSEGGLTAAIVDVWTRVEAELPLVPMYVPLNFRSLEAYQAGLSALAYSVSPAAKAVVYCGEGAVVQRAIHECSLQETGRVGPYSRDPTRVFWWAVLTGTDPLSKAVVDWLRLIYGDHTDLLAFLGGLNLLPPRISYILSDGAQSEHWDSWDGVVASASIWFPAVHPVLDLSSVPEGDIEAAQHAIDEWLDRVKRGRGSPPPRLQISRLSDP